MITRNETTKVKATLIVEIEGEFYDNVTKETLKFFVEQDLEDNGFNVINIKVAN